LRFFSYLLVSAGGLGGLVDGWGGGLHASVVDEPKTSVADLSDMSADASSSLQRFMCLSVPSLLRLLTIADPLQHLNLLDLSAQSKEPKTCPNYQQTLS
jgi:hypothetical protein